MFNFPGQREGEEVLEIIRKHNIVYFRIVMAFFIVILLPLTLLSVFWFTTYPFSEHPEGGAIVGVYICLVILFGLLFTCIYWIDEEFDVFIITTERLIDVTQVHFLKRTVASAPLVQIQDTTGVVNGFIPTLLHYGDLAVKTAAGNASEFLIDRVPDPEGAARRIINHAQKARGEHASA